MSIPRKKLHELIDLLPEDKTGEVINLLQNYVVQEDQSNRPDWDPEEFLGILDNLNINVKEECQKMREDWDNRGWDAISD